MSDSPQKAPSPSVPLDGQDSDKNNAHPHERRRWPRAPNSAEEASQPLAPALEPLQFTTRDLAKSEQFAAWQAYMSPLMDIKLPDGVSEAAGFPADHIAWNLGSMLVVRQKVPAHSYTRSLAKLRSNAIDHWQVILLRTGRTWTEVNRHIFEDKPGHIELRSLGHPFRGRTTDSENLSFYLPRELFSDTTRAVEMRDDTILSGTYTALLIDYLDRIEAKLPSLTAADLPRVVQTTRDMLLTCLSSDAEQAVAGESQGGMALMERIRRFVQKNLASPDLTPDALCRELGISRSRLYQLFEPSGGVLHYIQKRRLLSAHAALSNTANRQQIVEIAIAVGFTSAAHFSRAFSKEFGYSPREARNVSVPPYFAHALSPLEITDTRGRAFGEWLKSLGH
ncbi:MAG: helix-turn-helix domain-containing protein [Phyllobacterium sp.]|uniref:helix-turn-helix domain-containing protein n=1 Tax=Phyllobacterium sp. TaxID=1871046 RepID=UPI0030F192B4